MHALRFRDVQRKGLLGGVSSKRLPILQVRAAGKILFGLHLQCERPQLTEVVEWLLTEAHTDANERNALQGTPLHAACMWGHLTIAKVLLIAGADVHAEDSTKGRPLAAAAEGGHMELVELCMTSGAHAGAIDDAGMMALLCACRGGKPDMVSFLLEHRAHTHAGRAQK